MKTAFLVRTRDKKPFFSAVVSEDGTKFTALTERAKELVSALVDEYEDAPIPKAELSVSLDRGMTIDGPMPQTMLTSAIEKAKLEAEEFSNEKKTFPSITDSPISVFSTEEAKSIIAYKALAFSAERYKTTFNYEIKRVRATWDPTLSIPGTNRRGGWRCPTGTRYGGQITDRFGRNCGWGVARRIANAITNIGERLESVDDRRRGRRVNRRNERMVARLQNNERGGRLERGLRGVAERLEGDNRNDSGNATTERIPNQPIERAPRVPNRAEADNVQAPVRRRRGQNQQNRRGNLRESERRRMEREIVQPGAPRTDENAPRVEEQNAPEAVQPTPRPRRQRRRVASEQQAERTATRRPRNEEPVVEDRPARKPSKRVNNVAEQGALNLGSKWRRREDGSYERDGFVLILDRDNDGKVTGGTVRAPDGDAFEAEYGGEQNEAKYKDFADYLFGAAGGEVSKTPNGKKPKGESVNAQNAPDFRIPNAFNKGSNGHNPDEFKAMVRELPISADDKNELIEFADRADEQVDFMEDRFREEFNRDNFDRANLERRREGIRRELDAQHSRIDVLRELIKEDAKRALENPDDNNAKVMTRRAAREIIEANKNYEIARTSLAIVDRLLGDNAGANAQPQQNDPRIQQIRDLLVDALPSPDRVEELLPKAFDREKRDEFFRKMRTIIGDNELDVLKGIAQNGEIRVLNFKNVRAQIVQAVIDIDLIDGGIDDAERALMNARNRMVANADKLSNGVRDFIAQGINDPNNMGGRLGVRVLAGKMFEEIEKYERSRADLEILRKRRAELAKGGNAPDVRKRPASNRPTAPARTDVPSARTDSPVRAQEAPNPQNADTIRRTFAQVEVTKEDEKRVADFIESLPADRKAQALARWELLKQNANEVGVAYDARFFKTIAGTPKEQITEPRMLNWRKREGQFTFTNKAEAIAELNSYRNELSEMLQAPEIIARIYSPERDLDQDRTVIKKQLEDIAKLENIVQNWDADSQLFERAMSNTPHFKPDTQTAQDRMRAIGDIGKSIDREIDAGLKKRKSILKSYLDEKYTKNGMPIPYDDMTPEKYEQMSESEKISFFTFMYKHDMIKGTNGKFYKFEPVVRKIGQTFEVSVDISEVDKNGNIIRRNVGASSRSIYPGDKVYSNNLFIWNPRDRGAGLQTIYNQHAFEFLGKIGVNKAEVGAAQDGAFVWARIGYKQSRPPEAQGFQMAMRYFERVGAGGLISNEEEYYRIKYLVDKLNRGETVTHQEFIFAVAHSGGDKKNRALREEQIKQWFKANAPFRSGVLKFKDQGIKVTKRRRANAGNARRIGQQARANTVV